MERSCHSPIRCWSSWIYPALWLAVALSASGALRVWTGASANAFWSTPANWNPFGTPQNGDDLSFPDTAAQLTNDLDGLALRSIGFTGGSNSCDLWGKGVTLAAGIRSVASAGTAAVLLDITLAGDQEFQADGATLLIRNVALAGFTLALNATNTTNSTLFCDGQISGLGDIDKLGQGEAWFGGPQGNTYQGTVRVAEGTLNLIKGNGGTGLAITGPLEIGRHRTNFTVYTSGRVVLGRAEMIHDAARVTFHSGTLDLNGWDETLGPVDFHRGEIETGSGTLFAVGPISLLPFSPFDFASIAGTIFLTSDVLFDARKYLSDSRPLLTLSARVSGPGGIIKQGNGRLILDGTNDFSGAVIVNEGTLALADNLALGNSSGVTLNTNSFLALEDVTILDKALTLTSSGASVANASIHTCTWSGPIYLNFTGEAFFRVFEGLSPNALILSGPIQGTGGMSFGGEWVELTGSEANSYTGKTVCEVTLLKLNKPSGVRAISSRLEVRAAGRGGVGEVRWLQDYQGAGVDVTLFTDAFINLSGHRDDFGPLTFNSGAIATGAAGELGLYGLVTVNAATAEATIDGRLGLPPGPHEFRVYDGSAFPDLRIDATVLGAGNLRKTGPGQMWLTASNTYQGLTTVAEGVLSVLNPHGLGAANAGTTVDDGATLELNFTGASMPEPLAIRGTGVNGNGALGGFGDAMLRTPFPSIYAAIDLTTNATIAVAAGARLTVDGFISGVGPLTKTGAGTLVLANINPNTYSGDTFVIEGVLNLSKPNFAIAVPSNLVVGPAPLNSTAIARWSTSGGMNPNAIVTINARSMLDLNGNGLTLSRLNLNDGGDAQTGAGMLSFGVGGLIAVGSLSQLGSHAGSTFSGNIGLPANATLTFAVGAYAPSPPFDFNPELDISANIPAPAENPNFERAGITKSGPGTLRLSGTSSFNGRADVTEGTLIAASSLALGSSFDGTVVMNNAVLALENSLNIDNEVLALNSTAEPALENLSGDSYWSGPVIMNRHSTVGVQASSALQLAGVISGAAHFTKVGAGTLRFGGGDHNTYSGETFVNEGTLLLSKPIAVTAVPGALNIGASNGVPATVANLTSYQVIGNIFVNRNGLLNLNGQVENVDHLWLMEGGDVQTTTGVLFLKAGGSIQVFPGAVNDPATIAGNLEIEAGSHTLNVAASTSSTGGPDLDITALVTSSGGSINLFKINNGKVRLSANNTYTGSFTISAGVLQVDGSQPGSSVIVYGGTRLIGNGRTGPVTFGSPTGIVAPGTSPGNLQVGNFNLNETGGILEIELNGPTPGLDYDRLTVRGLVDLTGMSLQASVNFAATNGQQFLIVGNDLFDEITGEFNGLPEGASVTFGDHIFQITYVGGDGNDVVLTQIGEVYRPALRIERIAPASVRLLWPTNDPAFTLQFSTNLSATNWAAASPLPGVTGTNNVVTNATGDAWKFYRLFKP